MSLVALVAEPRANATFNPPTNLVVTSTIPSDATKTFLSTHGSYTYNYNLTYIGSTQVAAFTVPYYAREFNLTWKNDATEANYLEVYAQALDSISGHTNQSWYVIAYLLPDVTSLSWDSPFFNATGTQIQFRVVACKGIINASGPPTTTSRTNPAQGYTPYIASPASGSLSAPTNFQASITSQTDGLLHFQWDDINDSEEGYELFYREHNDTTPNAWPSSAQYSFTYGSSADTVISTLVVGKSYDFKIKAYRVTAYQATSPYPPTSIDASGDSNVSTVAIVSMAAPTGLTATAVNETTLRLSWTNNSYLADDYEVQYRPDSTQSFSTYQFNSPLGKTQSVDIFYLPNLAAQWQVVAAQNTKNAQGTTVSTQRSAPTNLVSTTLPFNPPANLSVNITSDPTTHHPIANFAWVDRSLVETGYAIMARPSSNPSGSFSLLSLGTTQNSTSTTVDLDGVVPPDTSYDFVVKAYFDYKNSQGAVLIETTSDNSNIVSAKYDGVSSLGYAPAAYQQAFTAYQMTATHTSSTVASMNITGLPFGLKFDSTTNQVIDDPDVPGIGPQVSGLFQCPMTVTYANGWVNSSILTLRVVRPPAVPLTPHVIKTRTIPVATTSLPLTELFADPDTEQAVRLSTNMGIIDMVLQPTLTPATTGRFMEYVNAGDYNGTVFHRLSPGFVIQGGGYKPAATPDHFVEVTPRASPQNEPGIPNLRGTVALAKGGTPSSGGHDFFITLADTSFLDTANGGFTVFGRIANLTPNPTTVGAPSTVTAYQVTPVIDGIQNLYSSGSASYTINLLQAGQSAESTNVDVFGGNAAGLGTGTIWPLTAASSTMDNTKCVQINTVTPLAVLSYNVTNSDPNNVDFSLSGNTLQLIGKVDGGTSTITVNATDVDSNTVSQQFVVTVAAAYQPVQITTQPAASQVNEGQQASIQVVATGPNLSYQWRKGDVDISSSTNATATNATLVIPAASLADIADYRVLVSNDANLVLSDKAHLTVVPLPKIVTQPADKTVAYGSPATMSVVATSDTTLSYQWYRNDNPGGLSSFHVIDGATSASYTLSRAYLTDSNSLYQVRITNAGGTVISNSAKLTVTTVDTDSDGLTDDVELLKGTSATLADTDGDGYSDSVELTLGTDPRVATSNPGSSYFIAQHDGLAALASLVLKNVPANASFRNPVNGFASEAVPQQAMAATEMTNDQFATALDIALNLMKEIEIVADGSRRFVRYPKTTGQIICYLAPLPSDTPPTTPYAIPSCEVGADEAGTTFYVTKALAKNPVRAVSWYGAFLASAAINKFYGYTTKCNSDWTYAKDTQGKDKPGFMIPTYTSWDWAAGNALTPYPLYTTGAAVTTVQANFNNTSAMAGPKAVKSYAASPLGLYDMGGNVAEWVFDQTTSPTLTSYVRGGNFGSPSTELLNTSKVAMTRETISDKVGFRLSLIEAYIPTITAPPQDQFVDARGFLSLSVTAKGVPPLAYQWFKNKVPLKGQTASTLEIAGAQLSDAGVYTVTVTGNGTGSKTTDGVVVSVADLTTPVVIALPGNPATFKVSLATASVPNYTFNYDWKKVIGSGLSSTIGATGTYTLPLATYSHDGFYRCTVTPPPGKGLSSLTFDAQLIVLKEPLALSGLSSSTNLPTGVVGGAYQVDPFSILFDGSTDRTPTTFSIVPSNSTALGTLPAGMTINPKTGVISGRPTVAVTSDTTYTFGIKATNIVKSAIVNGLSLVVKPLPVATVGTFVAIVANQASLNGNLGGRVDLTCTSNGSYSGKVTLAGVSYSFTDFLGASVSSTGVVSTTGSSTVLIPRTGKTTLYLTFTVDLSSAFHGLTGSIGEVAAGATTVSNIVGISGWRRLDFGGALASQLGRDGYHTLAVDPPTSVTDPAAAPMGSSYFTAKVADSGDVTQAGRLADGTALTGSGPMSWNGDVLVVNALYAGRGSVKGTYQVASGHAITLGVDGLNWNKLTTTDRNYPNGFSAMSLVLIAGGQYVAPAGVPVMGLLAGDPFAKNSKCVFTGGGLTSPSTFTQEMRITDANLVEMPTGLTNNPHTVTCKVDKNTGIFTGTFLTSTPARTANWAGVIVSKGSPVVMSAYGSFTLPSTSVATSPILSGSAVVQAQ